MHSRIDPSVSDYKNSLPTLVGEAVFWFWSWFSFWYAVFFSFLFWYAVQYIRRTML